MVNLLLTSDDRNTLRPSPTVVWGVCVSSARLMSRSVVTMLEDADKSPMVLEQTADICRHRRFNMVVSGFGDGPRFADPFARMHAGAFVPFATMYAGAFGMRAVRHSVCGSMLDVFADSQEGWQFVS